MRILVVEDDAQLRKRVSEELRNEGFAVDAAPDGDEGLYFATEYSLDLAIIDLGLPGVSGLDIIRSVRKAGKTFPILILTARSRWQEKVEGLEAGADDYVVKPFQTEELMARVRALLRRTGGWADSSLRCGELTLDPASQVVTLKGAVVELTSYEYKVLAYLMLHAGDVVSKTELTEHLYEEDQDRDSNVMEVFIRRLRQKLDPTGKEHPIETLRGRGYRLVWARVMNEARS